MGSVNLVWIAKASVPDKQERINALMHNSGDDERLNCAAVLLNFFANLFLLLRLRVLGLFGGGVPFRYLNYIPLIYTFQSFNCLFVTFLHNMFENALVEAIPRRQANRYLHHVTVKSETIDMPDKLADETSISKRELIMQT